MAYSSDVRRQLKGITPKRIIGGLLRDGWNHEPTRGATRVYVKHRRRVVIHLHPGKTYRSMSLIEDLLEKAIGWMEEDLVRLKFVKGKQFKKKYGTDS